MPIVNVDSDSRKLPSRVMEDPSCANTYSSALNKNTGFYSVYWPGRNFTSFKKSSGLVLESSNFGFVSLIPLLISFDINKGIAQLNTELQWP